MAAASTVLMGQDTANSDLRASLVFSSSLRQFTVQDLNSEFSLAGLNSRISPMHLFGEIHLMITWKNTHLNIGTVNGFAFVSNNEVLSSNGGGMTIGLGYTIYEKGNISLYPMVRWAVNLWKLKISGLSDEKPSSYSSSLIPEPNSSVFDIMFEIVEMWLNIQYDLKNSHFVGIGFGYSLPYKVEWAWNGSGLQNFPNYAPRGFMLKLFFGSY